MLFDLQSGVAALTRTTYDVCVCGTGPAGITVARELAAHGKKVALLEAGGLEYSDRSQEVYAGSESGLSTYNTALKGCRLRYFGGTSNHWTGVCGLFEPSDFWPKRYHDLPGWPIALAEVNARLNDAAAILDIDAKQLTPQPFGDAQHNSFQRPGLANSSPTRFGTKYRKELVESPHIDLFVNANLVDLQLSEASASAPSVAYGVVKNYKHEAAKITAKRFVLAMGAIENARVLLNANRQIPAGLGNHSDFVGRCFMEHFNVAVGRFVSRGTQAVVPGNGAISAREATVRKLNIGNGFLVLNANAIPQEAGRLGPLRGALRKAACEFDTVRDFARKFKDFDCAGDGVIHTLLEQTPNRDSRITLSKEVDEFGLRRAHVHWALSDADRRTIRSLGYELAKELLALDVARVQLSPFITQPDKEIEVWNHAHQMGTTRMSAQPRDGVVDTNARVHGIGNLYIAGSSVFPTGGGINPTLTIVLLALRLGQHLNALPA